jgi:pyrroline-5-carboxylate reductase
MAFSEIARRGLVMLGCGKMGSAMLEGWLTGICLRLRLRHRPASVGLADGAGGRVNASLPDDPAVVLLAVKPQMMADALPSVARFGGGATTLFVSVAAGTPIATFEAALGDGTRIIRAMPNTPAAIGKGITAIVGNAAAGEKTSPWPRRFCPPWARSCGWRPRTRSTR